MSAQSGTALELRGVTKAYAPGLPPAVRDLNLSVRAGELIALLGPSGGGKSTTLRLIAGFERPDEGEVLIGGQPVATRRDWVPPERRACGMVFQDYALFPHLDVLRNVMFGLRGPDRERRAREVLNLVGLTVFERRMPHELSGGQQQRVALARALAPRPPLILLDEPFSNLDAALRHATRQEVRTLLRDQGTAALLVTHDQEEALAFSDRLAVMRGGHIEQAGAPHDVYARPATAFVANFLGRSNLLSGTASGAWAHTPLGQVELSAPARGPVMVSLRPEQLAFGEHGAPARIMAREYHGRASTYTVLLGAQELLVYVPGPDGPLEGEEVRVHAVTPAHAVTS